MAGGRGNGNIDNKLKAVVEPVILTDIKEDDLPAIKDNDGLIPYEKLEIKQQRFVDEYMVDLNATAACVRAGYSPASATNRGSLLLDNANIRACIDRRMAEASRRTGVNADRVIRELARISFANPADAIADDGSISHDASEDDKAAIQSIKVKTTTGKNGTTTEREVRFYDKNKSLELLMRHAGMLIERKQVDVHKTIETMTSEQREQKIQELLAKRNTIDITHEQL
jgi:phage terminase small subunit